MILTISNSGILKIDAIPLGRMIAYKQDSKEKLEAGGVLLGRFILKSKNIIVDRITIPMIGDVRGRYQFIRGDKNHQRIITNIWNKTGGTCNYLGEWHTHPEQIPIPSNKDIENWKEILNTRIYSSRTLYFVIVGITEVRVWEGNRRTGKIINLK
jgi:integrative and conjugative element protein (TIGR02256 family)